MPSASMQCRGRRKRVKCAFSRGKHSRTYRVKFPMALLILEKMPYLATETEAFLQYREYRKGTRKRDNFFRELEPYFGFNWNIADKYRAQFTSDPVSAGKRKTCSMHIPQTLDCSYYAAIGNAEQWDSEQFVYRHTSARAGTGELLDKVFKTKVLMVNQLWLWKINGKQKQKHKQTLSKQDLGV